MESNRNVYLNMITGTAPAIGLGLERPPRGLMDKRERPPTEGLFTWEAMCDIMFYGILMGVLMLLNFILVEQWWFMNTYEVAQSTAFGSLTVLLLSHAYNCRSMRRPFFADGWYASYYLHFAVLFGAASTCAILYIPWVNEHIFHHVPIPANEWLLILGSCVVFMVGSELYKAVKRIIRIVALKVSPPTWLREERMAEAARLEREAAEDYDSDEDDENAKGVDELDGGKDKNMDGKYSLTLQGTASDKSDELELQEVDVRE